MGSGSSVSRPTPASEASERESARWPHAVARGAGIRRSAVVLADRGWLQKSTSGAGSWPRGHGSSLLAPRSRGRAQRAKARRKPGRGGESRQHASSDTGGGLLVIPRERRASVLRDRGREHSSDGRRPGPWRAPSLTRRRRKGIWRSEAKGIEQQCAIRRRPRQRMSETTTQARLGANSAHAERRSGEGSTIVTPPGLRGAAPVKPLARAIEQQQAHAEIVEAGGSPSSEAPLGRLIRRADREAPSLPPRDRLGWRFQE